jgi:hypothetical protein
MYVQGQPKLEEIRYWGTQDREMTKKMSMHTGEKGKPVDETPCTARAYIKMAAHVTKTCQFLTFSSLAAYLVTFCNATISRLRCSFLDMTRGTLKTMHPTILLLLRVYSLPW